MLYRARDIEKLYNTKINFLPWDDIFGGVGNAIGGAWDAITGQDKKKQEAAAKAAAEEERKKILEQINSSKQNNKIPLYITIGGISLLSLILILK